MYAVAAYRNTERTARPKLDTEREVVTKTVYIHREPARVLSFREQWEAQQARERREAEAIRAVVAQYRTINCTKTPVRDIIRQVAERHNVSVQDILGPRRTKHVVIARHEAICEAAKARPDMSLPALGLQFKRDHTSVLHALRKGGVPSSSVVRKHLDRET